MTGRDVVAIVLALGVVGVLLVYTVGIVLQGYRPTGDAITGAVVGAVLAVLARFVLDKRNGG